MVIMMNYYNNLIYIYTIINWFILKIYICICINYLQLNILKFTKNSIDNINNSNMFEWNIHVVNLTTQTSNRRRHNYLPIHTHTRQTFQQHHLYTYILRQYYVLLRYTMCGKFFNFPQYILLNESIFTQSLSSAGIPSMRYGRDTI